MSGCAAQAARPCTGPFPSLQWAHRAEAWPKDQLATYATLQERPDRLDEPTVLDDWTTNIDPGTYQPLGQLTILEFDGCAPLPEILWPSEPEPTHVWLPAGPVEDIRIHDNVIRKMDLSGISTALFFPAEFDYDGDGNSDHVPRFIVAAEIDIARNVIENNARNGGLPPANFAQFDQGVGGIVLAASVNAWIHENTIRNNGLSMHVPVCGVGLIAAQNAVIEDNRIIDNGVRHPGPPVPFVPRGVRGGIMIVEASPVRVGEDGKPTIPVTIEDVTVPQLQKDYTEASAESAVIVRGNEVSQPLGKALWIKRGFGPITVTGNSLEGYGDPVNNVGIVGTLIGWYFDGGGPSRVGGRA